MSSRGREYVLKVAAGVWFTFASVACSDKAGDVGGESHFACDSDAECDKGSVCVRERESSARGECRPIRGVGGSGGETGNGGSGTGGGSGAENVGTGGSSGAGDDGSGGSGPSTGGSGGDRLGIDAGAPAAPARGAVAFKVSPTPGKICAHTNGQLSAPLNVAGVVEALNCDMSVGCRPDEFVIVDGDRGANVTCHVGSSGDSFQISVSLLLDGAPTGGESIQFAASGVVSKTGGTPVIVSQSNSVSNGGGRDANCALSITAPRGRIEAGSIWANVHCENFRDPNDISETGCTLDGVFLFEDCSR